METVETIDRRSVKQLFARSTRTHLSRRRLARLPGAVGGEEDSLRDGVPLHAAARRLLSHRRGGALEQVLGASLLSRRALPHRLLRGRSECGE